MKDKCITINLDYQEYQDLYNASQYAKDFIDREATSQALQMVMVAIKILDKATSSVLQD